ncbi:MAG: hypothetical protein JSS68_06560 [Actinobacteria bacterium]|nr:hypothetical protein [Actinomycetota bacterium]
MRDREVLAQRSQECVVAAVPGRFRRGRDRLGAGEIVTTQRELVKELPHREAEILSGADACRDTGERLGQLLRGGWVGSQPI